jgi:hypothetical protein
MGSVDESHIRPMVGGEGRRLGVVDGPPGNGIVVTHRKSAVGKIRRVPKETGARGEPVRSPSGVHLVAGSLHVIENRARLSLECYRYTRDPYWLACAFDDCEKGRLDWNSLCELVVGTALPPPASGPRASGRE